MNEPALRPIRKRGSISPVLLELAVVILFFALSASVVLRLFAAASDVSRESACRSRALLALESVAERVKADPEGDGAFDGGGVRTFTQQIEADLLVRGVVTRDESNSAGVFYGIDLSVTAPDGTVYTLSAARYVSGGGTPP